jgi:hypothetical protein
MNVQDPHFPEPRNLVKLLQTGRYLMSSEESGIYKLNLKDENDEVTPVGDG